MSQDNSSDIETLLSEVEALDRAATPGPWVNAWDQPTVGAFGEHTAVVAPAIEHDVSRMIVGLLWYDGINVACSRDNAEWIARSRTLIPALAAEVRRLQGVQRMLGVALQKSTWCEVSMLRAMHATAPSCTGNCVLPPEKP